MDLERKTLRLGAAVIACALLLRLLGPAVSALDTETLTSFLLYMETGRVIRLSVPEAAPTQSPTQPDLPPLQTEPAEEIRQVSFSYEDAAIPKVTNYCAYPLDIGGLLTQPLDWDLKGDVPTVLILHTHTSESYEKGDKSYQESGEYRTLDGRYNMLAVGDALARSLEEKGIRVIHDRTLHDYPSYNGSYEDARAAMEAYLAQYPGIRLVLDLHRDAADDGYGGQVRKAITVDGQAVAQLMMVVGTDAGGLEHPNWQENMALALKMTVLLERQCPGITRPISFRSSRFNQDLSPGAMLIEVGAAGNSLEEALAGVNILAQAIEALAKGSTADSTN